MTNNISNPHTIYQILHKEYPNAKCELVFENPWQLLVATILSAQCTDVQVNKVTPNLFKQFPTIHSLANADIHDIEKVVKSTGFFHSKSKYIQNAAKRIINTYAGEVPNDMEKLITLPGVARKTANVVLQTAFGITVGVVVDTHVLRLSKRLGLSHSEDPKKVEIDLMRLFSKEEWEELSHLFKEHGRKQCTAKSPKCYDCKLRHICPTGIIRNRGKQLQNNQRKSGKK